LRLTQLTK